MTRIGLIGAGRWGRNAARTVSKALRTVVSDEGGRMTRTEPIAELAWVADADDAAARAVAESHNVHACDPRFICWDDCDAVWICTPIETHEILVHAALSAGKHVLCEKPLARSKAQAEDLAAAADRRGLVLMADHTWLGHAGARTVVDYDGLTEYTAQRWAKDDRGFDALEDMLPHDVVLARRAFRNDIHAVCTMVLGHQTLVVMAPDVETDAEDFKPRHCSVTYSYDYDGKIREMKSRGADGSFHISAGALPAHAPEPLSVILDEFISATREQRQPRIGGAAEFIHVAAVIEAAKASRARGGEWVDVQ